LNRLRSASAAPRHRMATDVRIFLLVASCAIPAAVLLVWISLDSALPASAQMAIGAVVLAWILLVAIRVREEVLRHVRTLSNLVESIRTSDYTVKGARAREPGELAELYQQINALTDSLRDSRQSEQELLNVLEKVVSQIHVAIIVCDADDRIRLVNRLAVLLLKAPAEELLGTEFASTVLAQLPASPEPRLLDFRFPGAEGRWQVSQHHYRHQGRTSRIVFIADLKQALSDEEIAAWQRLIRVISHEINNSLTPISSLCQTVSSILERPDSASYAEDVRKSLRMIGERASGLREFIGIYSRLARLPEPQRVPFPVANLAARLRGLFPEKALAIAPFPDVALFGDPVHLEQALINLVKNGLEANAAGAPPVELSCHVEEGVCEFRIADRGAGVGNPENLFVPFYTTKRGGTGIGLVFCRHIAAKHYGHVSLANRSDGPGAVAKLLIPLPPSPEAAPGRS
jgi:two-component system, NtrC family, nitrogen regulation sensor histidine kinase NtrY